MKIELNDVMSVYSGKNGACCCGCSGKHRYAKAHRAIGSKNRGYKVDDDEVSDVSVRRIVRKIEAAAASVTITASYVSAVVGDRLYTAYLVQGWRPKYEHSKPKAKRT